MLCCTSVLASLFVTLLLNVQHALADHAQHFKTENFTAPVMSVSRHGPVAPGLLFFSTAFGGAYDAPTIMDSSGELVWRSDENWESSNFNMQTLFDKPVLTFWTGTRDSQIGTGYGGVHILNSSYDAIHFVCGDRLDIQPLFVPGNTSCQIDPHESRITQRNTLLISARSVVQADLTSVGGPVNGWVLDSIVYELDILTENVLMRWSAYEHRQDFDGFTSTKLPLDHGFGTNWGSNPAVPWDFFHLDSVIDVQSAIDGHPNGFLVSGRYCWAVIKISNDGETEWYFTGNGAGDFTMPPSASFSFQHDVAAMNVTTTDMRVTMFDNANYGPTTPKRPSSGLVLYLDLINKDISVVKRYLPEEFISSIKMGSYMALPYENHSLVDFGYPAIINEFDINGDVTWEGHIRGPTTTAYRVAKKPWTGTPSSIPKCFAEYDGATTVIWMSWNGATEVRQWEVYGREKKNEAMQFLTRVHRSGFETAVRVKGRMTEVFALAMNDEQTLAQTNFTKVHQKLVPVGTIPTHTHSNHQTTGHHGGVGVGALELATRAQWLALLMAGIVGFWGLF